VGRRTVGAALQTAGLAVTASPDVDVADVDVLVVAETAKPEDRAVCTAARRPVLIVLNKADLLGGAGPQRAGLLRGLTGQPTVPMSALQATVTLDDPLVAALRAEDPSELVLSTLGRFGIAVLAGAARGGAGISTLTALLRTASNIDGVLAEVRAAAAPRRYLRLRSALTELHALAAGTADEPLAGFLAGDHTVLAAMDAAAEVLRAAGLDTEAGGSLQRARRWNRYGRGPVNALHRNCSADLARGALRLAARSGELA
jgi:hypothetical protein